MALAHLEWDLSAFSGVNSDSWDAEVSIEKEDPHVKVDAGLAEGGNPSTEVGEVSAHTVEGGQVANAIGGTVLIVDDEPEV